MMSETFSAINANYKDWEVENIDACEANTEELEILRENNKILISNVEVLKATVLQLANELELANARAVFFEKWISTHKQLIETNCNKEKEELEKKQLVQLNEKLIYDRMNVMMQERSQLISTFHEAMEKTNATHREQLRQVINEKKLIINRLTSELRRMYETNPEQHITSNCNETDNTN